MSHGDHVAALPEGFGVIASSEGAPYAVIADESRRYYGVQFHPELKSKPFDPHPLFTSFIGAAVEQSRLV